MSAWVAKNRKLAENDFPSKWNYNKRFDLYKRIVEKEGIATQPINYLEFGVASGYSFKWFLKENVHPSSRFYGFDTFTGLPEDFGPLKKGHFNSNTLPPEINDTRGEFFQGLFQQTLPKFLPRLDNSRRNVIMMDADLYSATLFTLSTLAPFLKEGDLIFFDEFAVPTHEFKALDEFQQAFYINLEFIGAASNFYFTAFKVTGYK
jgi:O-methyltransferase